MIKYDRGNQLFIINGLTLFEYIGQIGTLYVYKQQGFPETNSTLMNYYERKYFINDAFESVAGKYKMINY
jgi:hypothetical protein